MSRRAPLMIPRLRDETSPDPVATALRLGRMSPFSTSADGALRFSDPSLTEQILRLRAGTLQSGAAQWEARMSGQDVRTRRRILSGLNWAGAQATLDYALRDGRGEQRWVRETLEAVNVSDNRALLVHGVIQDITAEHESRDRLLWAARHDAATGLSNRDAFIEAAATLGALSSRVGTPACLLRIRPTNLEDLREVYGAEIGDRILAMVARRLEDDVRAPDALGRLSGADFAVAMLGRSEEPSMRLQALLSETPYHTPFGPLYLDMAVTARALGDHPDSAETALRQTRSELDGCAHGAQGAPCAVTEDVLRALDEDRVSLAFQPIVDAQTGQLHHHECLLRIRCTDGRVVSAWETIRDAEALGLVHRLDRRALALAEPHLRADPDTRLALNVSAGTLGNADHADAYVAALRDLGEVATRITIEMTETLAVDDPAQASRFSAAVRALGCRFAIDDFGSGYTTFRNLMAVEADTIKIDGALIQGIATDENKQTFMRMMVDLAHTFSVKTVAEMVETEADAAVLRRIGADYLQGYHYGHPAPSPNWSRLGTV